MKVQIRYHGVPVVGQQERIQLGSMRMWVPSLASLSGSVIQHCCELWCRSQTWLGPCVSVTVVKADSSSSNSAPSLGTSICCVALKGQKKKKILSLLITVIEWIINFIFYFLKKYSFKLWYAFLGKIPKIYFFLYKRNLPCNYTIFIHVF